jgi:predicted dehydrogenase
MPNSFSRRKFLQQLGGSTALIAAGDFPTNAAERNITITPRRKVSSNDTVRIACIGMGIMGFGNVKTAIKIPGVQFVAAADLYDGRLIRTKEVFGNEIFTTRDYREILERKDIDAVIIATSDHWHDRISIDAMNKGKHVYCEKPMVHQVEEGKAVIETQKKTGKVFQVGSQRISSIAFHEAKKAYKSGIIGQLNCIEATYDRHSANGAWQYSIPPDASLKTVDWEHFLGDAPKKSWNPVDFFRWRNYREYGTGVAGDLFVHLLTGVHFLTDSLGPNRIFATGDLSYWKDGRNVPDVMTAIMEYPATKEHPSFQLMLRVNFASGAGEKSATKFIGTDGVIDMGWNDYTIQERKLAKAPGYGGWDSYDTFPLEIQKQYKAEYEKKYSKEDTIVPKMIETKYKVPAGYDERNDHFLAFFDSIRTGKQVVEDASFGLRACAPCLLCNESYFHKKEMKWDPVKMVRI